MPQTGRPWTDEEVEKLLNLAQKYSAARIATEIGRPETSVRTKAHELSISLRMYRGQRPAINPEPPSPPSGGRREPPRPA
jgi:hypothetical protein